MLVMPHPIGEDVEQIGQYVLEMVWNLKFALLFVCLVIAIWITIVGWWDD